MSTSFFRPIACASAAVIAICKTRKRKRPGDPEAQKLTLANRHTFYLFLVKPDAHGRNEAHQIIEVEVGHHAGSRLRAGPDAAARDPTHR
jgi:hypothetical protein